MVCVLESTSRENKKHIAIRTFGLFDIYVDGEIVVFTNRRAKELLAILVDHRGGMVTTQRIINTLWPEDPENEKNKALYRKALMDLKKTFKKYGIDYILISKRGQKSIVVSEVDCDYYKAISGSADSISEYFGEYMIEYSWAENTNAKLHFLTKKNH